MSDTAKAYIDIIPRLQEYQSGLAKLPGWTDKQASAAAKRLEKHLVEAQTRASKAAMSAAERSAGAWDTAFASMKGVVGGLFAVDAVGGIKDFLAGIGEARRDLLILSQSTGIAVETLDGLRLGAKLAGVDFAAVGDVFEDFSGSVVDFARDGSGKGQKVFAELGIAVRGAGGELRSTNDVLLDTLRKLQDMENPTQRAGYLVQLFSDKAGQLQAVLGSVDIDTLIRGAERFGIASGQAAQNTASWTKATGALSVALEYAATSLTEGLFGTDTAGALQRFTTGFIAAFSFTQTYVKSWARDQIDAIKAVWDALTFKGSAIDAAAALLDSLNPVDNLIEAKNAAADAAKEWITLQKAVGDTTGATVGNTRATLVNTQAQDQARAAAEKRAREEQTAYDRLIGVVADYRTKGMDAWQQIADRRDRAIAQVEDLVVSERTAGAAAQAVGLIRQQALRDEIALRDELSAKFLEQVRRQKEADQQALERTVAGAQEGIAAAFAQLDAEEEADAAHRKLIDQNRETQKNAFNQTLDYASQTVAGMLELFDTQTRGGRKAALALFAVQKAVSVAQIAVNTAQAITAALTIPPPAGPILAVGIGAAAAVQAGAALAAQPRFHTGLFNDEQPAVVRRGEVVVPAPMVAANGGAEQVRQKLRDDSSDRPIIVRAVFSDREVAVPLAREVGWYMPRDALMGWRDG